VENNSINEPLVSVIIPAYNAEKHIMECLQSVLRQTYPKIQIIVVDDGSTDGTSNLLKTNFLQGTILLVHQDKKGASAARNTGYGLATGDLIKFLDADDIINSTMIEEQVKLAALNPDCIISSKWGRFHADNLETFTMHPDECWQTLPPCSWITKSWLNAKAMTQCGMFLLPRAVIEKAGLWDESLSLIDDLDFFTRVMINSELIIFSPGAIVYYRSGIAGSLSTQRLPQAMLSAYRSISKATTAFLTFCSTKDARQAAANLWQTFIFEVYPEHTELIKKAETHISSLVKPTVEYPCGGYSKLVLPFLGWKLTKTLQIFSQKYKLHI
jgi:glycosyltransferase involved in cell wall biosynthesis